MKLSLVALVGLSLSSSSFSFLLPSPRLGKSATTCSSRGEC